MRTAMTTTSLRKLFAPKAEPAWTVVPATRREIDEVVRHCRRLVGRRALVAAGVSDVPLPGVDWVNDDAVLMQLIPAINHAFC
jgi:hypothetical protein